MPSSVAFPAAGGFGLSISPRFLQRLPKTDEGSSFKPPINVSSQAGPWKNIDQETLPADHGPAVSES